MKVGYALDVIAKLIALSCLMRLKEQIFLSVIAGRYDVVPCPGSFVTYKLIDILILSKLASHVQKVFPEAAAAGQNPDQNVGLPSDDSDDNDYDPDEPEIDEESPGNESSSDESDFISASDELEAPPVDEQHLGLPSDDSEDDDYNPDAPDLDEKLEESSSSHFTSDSEDLAATFDGKELSREDENRVYIGPQGDTAREGSKHGGNKKQPLRSELLSILEASNQDGSVPISGKRNMERLDYQRVYNVSFLSSYILIKVLFFGHVPPFFLT